MARHQRHNYNTHCAQNTQSIGLTIPPTDSADIFFGLGISTGFATLMAVLFSPYALVVFPYGVILTAVLLGIAYWTTSPERLESIKRTMENVNPIQFMPIKRQYRNTEELLYEYRKHSLEGIQTVIGIDYTVSNDSQGERTFKGHSLHAIRNGIPNPYEQVITKLGRTLQELDNDGMIPVYGFGDKNTRGHSVFPLIDGVECNGYDGVLEAYRMVTPSVQLDSPTNFAPLIYTTIELAKTHRTHHVLIIITDGEVTLQRETEAAIVEASNYPISIIAIGVGDGDEDGNFGCLETYDDQLPTRKFDNFQFVKWSSFQNRTDDAFTIAAMEELPEQMKMIKRLKLM